VAAQSGDVEIARKRESVAQQLTEEQLRQADERLAKAGQ
jgi:hypothetical protein